MIKPALNFSNILTILCIFVASYANYKATVARYDEILAQHDKEINQLRIDRDVTRATMERINNEGTAKARTEWANALSQIERMDRRVTSLEEYIYRTLGPTIQRIDATVNKAKKPTSNSPNDE